MRSLQNFNCLSTFPAMHLKKSPLLLFLFLVFCSSVFAKSGREIASQIAPLLDEQTAFVVHIDLLQIDFRTVCEEAISQLEPFLASLDIDEKSIQGIAREAKKILRKGEKKIQDRLDTLIDKCGVYDVYLLGNGSLEFFAIPLEHRTAAEREALVSLLKETSFLEDTFLEFGSGVQERNGFQVFGTFLPERFEELPAKGDAKVKATLEDALKQVTGTPLQAVAFFNSAQTNRAWLIPFSQPKSENERQWNELVDSMRKKIQCGVFTFDVSRMECMLVLQALSEPDAESLEQDFRRGIDLIGKLARESLQEDQDMAFLAPLVAEFLKGALKTVHPERDGNRFILQYEDKMVFPMLINSGVGIANFIQ